MIFQKKLLRVKQDVHTKNQEGVVHPSTRVSLSMLKSDDFSLALSGKVSFMEWLLIIDNQQVPQ